MVQTISYDLYITDPFYKHKNPLDILLVNLRRQNPESIRFRDIRMIPTPLGLSSKTFYGLFRVYKVYPNKLNLKIKIFFTKQRHDNCDVTTSNIVPSHSKKQSFFICEKFLGQFFWSSKKIISVFQINDVLRVANLLKINQPLREMERRKVRALRWEKYWQRSVWFGMKEGVHGN